MTLNLDTSFIVEKDLKNIQWLTSYRLSTIFILMCILNIQSRIYEYFYRTMCYIYIISYHLHFYFPIALSKILVAFVIKNTLTDLNTLFVSQQDVWFKSFTNYSYIHFVRSGIKLGNEWILMEWLLYSIYIWCNDF